MNRKMIGEGGSYLMQRAKLFAYENNNIDIKRILQDKQFHLQLKSEQKEIIQNVLERKDSMAECCQWASERACVTSSFFGQGKLVSRDHVCRFKNGSQMAE
jgi:hypothetical protein